MFLQELIKIRTEQEGESILGPKLQMDAYVALCLFFYQVAKRIKTKLQLFSLQSCFEG